MTYKTARQVLKSLFDGNVSEAARATRISRQSWHKWKRENAAVAPKLELWLLKQEGRK